MSEEEIVRELRKGGKAAEGALRALYVGTAQHMLNFFVYSGVSGDDARDILQDTLMKLVCYANTYNGDGAARSWIWQIARNCLADHQRRAGRWSDHIVTTDEAHWDQISDTYAAPITSDPEDSAAECFSNGLKVFGEEMPERAYALTLAMDGCSMAEISRRLGRTEAATKQYLSQCRKKIQPFIAHCADLLIS
jgi:RNA polymerase sigma-70 factor (ECF subfamily)